MVHIIVVHNAEISNLTALAAEASSEGFLFVQRTIDEWQNGENQFSNPGEALWALKLGSEIIGIGGLNLDPYTTVPGTGRVRHLYIRKGERRQGYATLLMDKIIKAARDHFTLLRLYTDNEDAEVFYQSLGFTCITGYKVSHQLQLNNMD